jgi:hypothetical protein
MLNSSVFIYNIYNFLCKLLESTSHISRRNSENLFVEINSKSDEDVGIGHEVSVVTDLNIVNVSSFFLHLKTK